MAGGDVSIRAGGHTHGGERLENLEAEVKLLQQKLEEISNAPDNSAAALCIRDAGALFAGGNVEAALQEVGQDIADLRTLTGTADGAYDLGAFPGVIQDGSSVVRALESLATAVETHKAEIADLRTLTGTIHGERDVGAFPGTTISDYSNFRQGLQELETAIESANAGVKVSEEENSSSTQSVVERQATEIEALKSQLSEATSKLETTIGEVSRVRTLSQMMHDQLEVLQSVAPQLQVLSTRNEQLEKELRSLQSDEASKQKAAQERAEKLDEALDAYRASLAAKSEASNVELETAKTERVVTNLKVTTNLSDTVEEPSLGETLLGSAMATILERSGTALGLVTAAGRDMAVSEAVEKGLT